MEKEDGRKDKRKEVLIMFLAVVSIIGFFFSVMFLVGITGAAIGTRKENLIGLIAILASLLVWAIAETIWLQGKRKKEVDIKNLLKEAEAEGLPMIYKKK